LFRSARLGLHPVVDGLEFRGERLNLFNDLRQLRADLFNAFNRAGITGRNTTLQLNTPADPVTNVQPAFDPVTGLLNDGVNLTSTGAVSPNRSQPKNAGFGVANAFQAPRSIQLQVRFAF